MILWLNCEWEDVFTRRVVRKWTLSGIVDSQLEEGRGRSFYRNHVCHSTRFLSLKTGVHVAWVPKNGYVGVGLFQEQIKVAILLYSGNNEVTTRGEQPQGEILKKNQWVMWVWETMGLRAKKSQNQQEKITHFYSLTTMDRIRGVYTSARKWVVWDALERDIWSIPPVFTNCVIP